MPSDASVFSPATVAKHYRETTRHTVLPNGLSVEYAVHGADDAPEKVLLIMGLHFEKEAWLPLIATLLDDAERAPRVQLVSFDNRGVGGSDKPWAFYSTTQMAHDTLQLLDALQWPSAHIVGISMGGMISQELAHAAPRRVQSLSLLVTAPGFRRGPLPRLYQLAGYWKSCVNMILPTRESITDMLLYILYPDTFLGASNGHVGKLLQDFHMHRLQFARNQISGAIGQATALLRHDMSSDRLRQIQAAGFPILVVAAKLDRLLHSDNSKLLYKHLKGPQTHKLIFDDTGHGVHVQKRHEVASALLQLFSANPMAPVYPDPDK
ncbi:hypothetical protein SPRG_17102 [Saprolegnia parasitica CBS 223.65]|uniref:AB hydrolase-1 domain-containing protein n=1 Tax=Saprolegnia parasitica (strain CBS 223.65) TaxID=695850 RepID=A0A067BL32_SAPPC|nr:hypothetical protein SPRG_17102 [Saprolegnia parasitica CBS 223.65]KDO17435.1 hypothetical protein SPRG_17102 [Saprolegnia parasitica CBS 223.65]|eukprot:XP_012211857.1 hypothetical protein SPRG_17102 [Saprolegnia parasitica CBS 223.65]